MRSERISENFKLRKRPIFLSVLGRARTESIHFDSPKWIKNHKKIWIREVNQNPANQNQI